MNLYFIHTIDMFGDAIIELRASDLPIAELNEQQDDYFNYIGILTTEDAEKMQSLGYEPTEETQCIKYASEVLNMAIPEIYTLITVTD